MVFHVKYQELGIIAGHFAGLAEQLPRSERCCVQGLLDNPEVPLFFHVSMSTSIVYHQLFLVFKSFLTPTTISGLSMSPFEVSLELITIQHYFFAFSTL